jgi:hypothetical protein
VPNFYTLTNRFKEDVVDKNNLAVCSILGLALAVASSTANAGTKTFKCSGSGTVVDLPIDPDGDSCFTAANGVTVCTDASGQTDLSGSCSPGGAFTTKNVVEVDPVPGSGCNIGGTVVPGLASCTLANGGEQGCAFQAVGGAEVDRDKSSGDLLFSTQAQTFCWDLSSGPPFNFTGTFENTISGGTGKNAGATGSSSGTFHGQTLTLDPAFHGLGWVEVNSEGTITTP